MPYRPKVDLAVFTLAVALSRFAFRSRELYDLDSVNFALGIARFDPRVHQPHPPGYFLYICCGRLLNHFLHNPNLALVLLSIATSCGTVIFIYLLALNWRDQLAARFAALLFLLSPLAWFHGIVALTYSVEAFFSALMGFLCWLACRGEARWIPVASVVLGISAGVRPSSLLLLGPLFLFTLYKASTKYKVVGLVLLGLTLAAWFIPMLLASGGPHAYFGALESLWRLVPSKTAIWNSSPVNSLARAITIVFIFLLTFGAACLAPLGALGSTKSSSDEVLFSAVWTVPALCFFTFVYLRFVNSGYLLLLVCPGCVWLGYWISEWYVKTRMPRGMKLTAIAVGAAINIAVFLFSPLYCSFRSIRRFESQLRTTNGALTKIADPYRTVVVAFDSHFLGFRHAGYSLPQYLILEYPEVKLTDGTQVFAMNGQRTSLLRTLPVMTADHFVFFPLPSHSPDYQQYLEGVKSKLPPGAMTLQHVDGVDFTTAPISCLGLLFPNTVPRDSTRGCVSGVSTAR